MRRPLCGAQAAQALRSEHGQAVVQLKREHAEALQAQSSRLQVLPASRIFMIRTELLPEITLRFYIAAAFPAAAMGRADFHVPRCAAASGDTRRLSSVMTATHKKYKRIL